MSNWNFKYGLRYHDAYRDQLLGFHDLDWALVPGIPLDPRHHQFLQLATLRDAISVRYLRLLRRVHLLAEGRPSARAFRQ